MSTRVKARAKVGTLTRLTWSGGKKGKDWHFEEKKGTWMGEGRKVSVRVHCKTRDGTLTYDGVYDSITNELTFYRPTEEDTWEGVIHFDPIRLPVNGPYIEWKNGKEWVAKNWKWWSNTVIGTAVLAVLVATRQHVNTLKGKLTTAEYDANILKGKLTTAEDDANKIKTMIRNEYETSASLKGNAFEKKIDAESDLETALRTEKNKMAKKHRKALVQHHKAVAVHTKLKSLHTSVNAPEVKDVDNPKYNELPPLYHGRD